jgi:hypothetical protein
MSSGICDGVLSSAVKGQGHADALREAQLARKAKWHNPIFWVHLSAKAIPPGWIWPEFKQLVRFLEFRLIGKQCWTIPKWPIRGQK